MATRLRGRCSGDGCLTEGPSTSLSRALRADATTMGGALHLGHAARTDGRGILTMRVEAQGFTKARQRSLQGCNAGLPVIVFDSRHASTFRLAQSLMAPR